MPPGDFRSRIAAHANRFEREQHARSTVPSNPKRRAETTSTFRKATPRSAPVTVWFLTSRKRPRGRARNGFHPAADQFTDAPGGLGRTTQLRSVASEALVSPFEFSVIREVNRRSEHADRQRPSPPSRGRRSPCVPHFLKD